MESFESPTLQSHPVAVGRAGAVRGLRFSQLSVPRQALVRLCQALNYGSIEGLHVRDREPAFSPPPLLLVDLRLDTDEAPRPEIALADFELSKEICRLTGKLDELTAGIIEQIEVRAGLPRRVVFRGR